MNPITLTLFFLVTCSILLAIGLAGFVLLRNRSAAINRLMAAGLAAFSLYQASFLGASLAPGTPWQPFFIRLAFAIAAAFPGIWMAFSLRFGDTGGDSRMTRWRPVMIVFLLAAPLTWVGLLLGIFFEPLAFRVDGHRFLLIGIHGWGKVYFSIYVVALALVLLQMENLYRQAERMVRWKIRYLVIGLFVIFGFQIVAASYPLLYSVVHPLHGLLSSVGFLIGECLIAFALIRHRLLDVDIFVSRYVVYRSLTLALIGGYLLTLGLAAEVFRRLEIPLDLLSGTLLAIVGATALAVLLLSEDVRRRTKLFINTHFYKHKYDYRTEWMEYTRRLSKATDIPQIAAQTVTRILEVVWVRQAAIYASTSNPAALARIHHVGFDELPDRLTVPPELLQRLQEEGSRIAAEVGQTLSLGDDLGLARMLFGDASVGFLMPIMALDAMVGLLVVGPEITGRPFGADDRDLLAAVSAQAGALMLNARLAQEASEGRELQILARLSAFVAHDLKNAVSMLAMLAENAKAYIHKPEFQADAIRTLADITARIQKLLTMLHLPSGHLSSMPRSISLAPAIESWLDELSTQIPSRITTERRIGWTPDVLADPDQLRSVLQNLILNAVEAIPDTGTITVETYTDNGAALLRVSDTGRGMSPEFVRERLFRPFRTTKPNGLGIGLFQCRQIVEQFGGTLTAHSDEGRGTKMSVRLPASGTRNAS
jgi:hypothetical protein